MSQVPTWIEDLVEIISAHIEAHNEMGPLGFRWLEEDQFWEVIIYPTPVELIGGAVDGELVAPGFSLDLWALPSVFDEVIDVIWRAHSFGPLDPDGPYISIEGVFQGHHLCLRVLSEAPDDEEPGLKLNVMK